MELALILGSMCTLFFVLTWQIGKGFRALEERLDDRFSAIHEQFEGLREYLYEIDPQFSEELRVKRELASGDVWSGSILHQIEQEKAAAGKRTLGTRFFK